MLSAHLRHFLHLGLLLLVFSGAGSIHGHVCLDGMEPPLTVHFEHLGGHPHHHDAAHEDEPGHLDTVHSDVENELLPQVLPGNKTLDQDSPVFLTAFLFIFCLPLQRRPRYRDCSERNFHPPPTVLLPPLRAPPLYSV
jgi:hypothetical protein